MYIQGFWLRISCRDYYFQQQIMKRTTSIYCSQVGKENRQSSNFLPTRRKNSADTPITLSNTSFKDSVQTQMKSTSDFNDSLSTFPDKIGKKSHESSLELELIEQSCYDSLEQYEKKLTHDPMLTKLLALRGIFSTMTRLRALEGDRKLKRELSSIQNDFLSLQRELMRE